MIEHLALTKQLVEYLNDNVLEVDRLSALDVLDALASEELVLLPDSSGAATKTYCDLLSETA